MAVKERPTKSSFFRISLSSHHILRVSVLCLQGIGSFPFTWSDPPQRPQFSLGLCLWSIFMNIFIIFGTNLSLDMHIMTPDDWIDVDIGTMTAKASIVTYFIASNLSIIIITFKSSSLADLMGRLPEPPKERRNASLSQAAFVVLLTIHHLLTVIWTIIHYSLNQPTLQTLTISITMTALGIFRMTGYTSIYLTFSALSVRLSGHLLEAETEALSSSSSSTGLHSPLTLAPLLLLEKQIRKVGT